MPGAKRTAAAAATLAFSAVPLPLASASDPAKHIGSLPRPAPVAATKTPQPPAPAATTPQPPAPAATTPQAPAPAATTPQAAAPAATTPQAPVAPATGVWSTTHRARVQHDVRRLTSPKAHAASDPANTITDFKFSPGTMTIHVGDTVTWTNSGPSPHTATANNGSFDTPTLAKGASASHTFTQSGTFAYICKIHPFMKGTVVVLAASTTPSSNSPGTSGTTNNTTTTPSTAAGPTAAPSSSAAPTLPVTGLDVPALVAVGLGLLALGRLVRRRAV